MSGQLVGERGSAHVYDAIVIGGGITGLGELWELTDRGFTNVRLLERGGGLGGTWFWNRYPGSRFDSESYTYGYFRDPDLLREWRWTEHFGGQPEVESYLNHVADRFDLRKYIDLEVCVGSATWDESARTWTITTDRDVYVTRALVTALGIFSTPFFPPYAENRSVFGGVQAHTALWPREGVDLSGKRVAVVGTGSSGIQIVPAIVDEVESLTVFQRTPNWAAPLNNAPVTDDEFAEFVAAADAIHAKCLTGFGFVHSAPSVAAADTTPAERRAHFESLYAAPGLSKMTANYVELFVDAELNREFTDFLAERIRERVHDPATAEVLIPTDHAYTAKRPPMESGYYESFNHPHVSLISLREDPIEEVIESGLRTRSGDHEFDVVIWATGFDAITGSFDAIDFRGVDGISLREAWDESPWTLAGIQTPGFPNLFILGGPHAVGGNFPRATEVQQVFVADLLGVMRDAGQTRIEADSEAADAWTAHALSTGTGPFADSSLDYNFGGNIESKKKVFRAYLGGLDGLKGRLDESLAADYAGFLRS